MRRITTMIGLAVLTACSGAALLAPVPPFAPASCRPAELVTWLSAAPAEEQAEQDAWCAAVGTPLVRNVETPAARLDSIAVVSWNVKVGGGDVTQFVQRLRGGAYTNGQPVEHFVLLLQEVHRSGEAVPERAAGMHIPRGIYSRSPDGSRKSIDDAARALGLSLAYVPSMRNGKREAAEDRGNAIVTTLPLRDVIAIELPLVRQRRVAIAATVASETSAGTPWELQLASVHLETRPSFGVTGVSQRQQQMARLLEVLPPASSSVIGGDLNTWAGGTGEPAVALAIRQFPEGGAGPAKPTLDGPAFFNVRLDYLFARLPGGRLSGYDRIGERHGSDHYPVLAWVILSG